jgi:FkbM family methyltransferase
MSIINHKIKYELNEVIISVGYFKKQDIELLYMLVPPKYVEAYDPLPEVYKKYEILSKIYPTLVVFNKAVSDCDKNVELSKRKYNSTIKVKNKNDNTIKIKAVSFTDLINRVFDKHSVIDKVLFNCEGEEINIIKNTSIDIFKKCKYILVSFHDFVEDFGITDEDVKICIEKLSLTHNAKHFEKDCNWWEFELKNG